MEEVIKNFLRKTAMSYATADMIANMAYNTGRI